MSRHYPDHTTCEHCGETVAYNPTTGKVRPHQRLARDAGKPDAQCVLNTESPAQSARREATKWQRLAQPQREEWWATRNPDSALPPHLR